MSRKSFVSVALVRSIIRALRDRRGATATEYGLILAFVVVGLIVGLTALAGSTTGMWNTVENKVTSAR